MQNNVKVAFENKEKDVNDKSYYSFYLICLLVKGVERWKQTKVKSVNSIY